MDINTLKDKVTNAEQKVAKCEATVEKHKVQLQKKIDKFNKLADKLGYEHYDFYNSFYELNNAITDTSIRDDLSELEDQFDIGYESNSNENGFYAKDFYFYHYAD